jgi:hypothetical protein
MVASLGSLVASFAWELGQRRDRLLCPSCPHAKPRRRVFCFPVAFRPVSSPSSVIPHIPQETLEEEKETDEKLTESATEIVLVGHAFTVACVRYQTHRTTLERKGVIFEAGYPGNHPLMVNVILDSSAL